MSATLTRKQREIAEREQLILDVAVRMLLEDGYLAMNMDRIAKATEYSKGTIYQHFSCKEDLLMAVANKTAEHRVAMFARASAFTGTPRERMVAVGTSLELFVRLHPQHFRAEQIVMAESIRDKTSPDRLENLILLEQGCMGAVVGIISDAVAQGDVTLRDGVSPVDVCFGLWSLSFGGLSIIQGRPTLSDIGVTDPRGSLRRAQHAVMDGFDWRPLTTEWDYEATRARVLQEVFPDEAQRAGLL